MTLAIPSAQYLLRRPGGVRRGRLPEVPVELYHELDELFEQVDGLRIITSANRSAVLAASTGGAAGTEPPPPTGTDTGGLIERGFPDTIQLGFDGSAAATTTSQVLPEAFPFEIRSVTIVVESSTGAAVTANPFLFVGNSEVFTSATNSAKTFTHLTGRTFGASSIDNNTPFLRRFQPAALKLRLTSASPSARVSGSIEITRYIDVPE